MLIGKKPLTKRLLDDVVVKRFIAASVLEYFLAALVLAKLLAEKHARRFEALHRFWLTYAADVVDSIKVRTCVVVLLCAQHGYKFSEIELGKFSVSSFLPEFLDVDSEVRVNERDSVSFGTGISNIMLEERRYHN